MKTIIIISFIGIFSCSPPKKCTMGKAQEFKNKGEINLAIECFNQLLLEKDSIEAATELISIYQDLGNLNMAIKYAEKTFRGSPNDLENLLGLGNLYYKNQEKNKALNIFLMLERRDSLFPTLNYNLAVIYLNEFNAVKKALTHILKEIKYNTPVAEDYALLGQVYLNLDNLRGSVEAFNKAIQMDNKNSNFYFLRAIVYYYSQKPESAKHDLKECLNLNPVHIECLQLKIEVDTLLNDPDLCNDLRLLESLIPLGEYQHLKENC